MNNSLPFEVLTDDGSVRHATLHLERPAATERTHRDRECTVRVACASGNPSVSVSLPPDAAAPDLAALAALKRRSGLFVGNVRLNGQPEPLGRNAARGLTALAASGQRHRVHVSELYAAGARTLWPELDFVGVDDQLEDCSGCAPPPRRRCAPVVLARRERPERSPRALQVELAAALAYVAGGAVEFRGIGATLASCHFASFGTLTHDTAVEVLREQAHVGLLDLSARPLAVTPPFRAPHHTVSEAGLRQEVLLARHGTLVISEPSEFRAALAAVIARAATDGTCRVVLTEARADVSECYGDLMLRILRHAARLRGAPSPWRLDLSRLGGEPHAAAWEALPELPEAARTLTPTERVALAWALLHGRQEVTAEDCSVAARIVTWS